MVIAVASGKGGTGKTTVAVNLALTVPRAVRLLDCDVEEPNCQIFLKASIERREPVNIAVPVVDEGKCTACGECSQMCQYNAIVSLKTRPLVFPELCHACGGCAKVCPVEAIREVKHEVGIVEFGARDSAKFVCGRLKVGQPLATPVVRAVRRSASSDAVNIVDCPPGTSCPVIAAMREADAAILVAEPTPFGLHDLVLAVQTAQRLQIPSGVVINRSDAGDARVRKYCVDEGLPVLLEIPEDRRVAEAYSRGEVIVNALPEYRAAFERLWTELNRLVQPASHMFGGTARADV